MPLRAILIVLALLHPLAGEAREPIEVKWKQSNETDLRNGDPAGDVYTKAKRRAAISGDVAFKNWAYNIASRTCPSAGTPIPEPIPAPSPAANCPLLSPHDARKAARGEHVRLTGGGCLMIFNGLR